MTSAAVKRDIASGYRRARRREALLGLLFAAPATIVMLIFGLFPVVSGFLISLQGGTILPEGFVGLSNYSEALGSLAYLLVILVALALLAGSYVLFRRAYSKTANDGPDPALYLNLIPGSIAAISVMLLVVLLFTNNFAALGLLPYGLLAVALIVYAIIAVWQHGLRFAAESFVIMLLIFTAIALLLFDFSEMQAVLTPPLEALSQAVSAANKYIVPLTSQFVALFGAVAAAGVVLVADDITSRIDHFLHPRLVAVLAVLRWLMLLIAILFVVYIIAALELLRGTITALARVTPETLATITSLTPADLVRQALIWPQVFTILLGMTLIGLAYLFWSRAARQETTPGMLSMLGIAVMLMIGGWMLIGQLPAAAASGDPDFYQSLLRTATYAFLTVPVQLSLGLLLAYLLFYEVRLGKSFYRVAFFIPYIAPVVATASVFAVVFALTKDGPANQILQLFGIPPQQWLRDPRGVFEIIAQLIGGRQVRLPPFLVGPSLPLMSAIIFNIWVYSGYDAVIFLAGLGAVPTESIEAAQVDGAGRWQNFRHIIFPLISPTTFFLSILAIVGTFKSFDSVYVLREERARGAMDVATVYIFQLIRTGSSPWAYAAATAFVLFGIILILTLIQNRVTRDQVFYG